MDWGAIIDDLVKLVGLNSAIFTFCTTKYLIGVGLALSYSKSVYDSILFSVTGGITGIFFYLYIYKLLLKIFRREVKSIKIKFNRWRRFIIKVKQKGGLFGIALITPLFLSIPLGIGLSLTLGSTKRRILIFHITSIVFWSLLIFAIKHSLGYDVTETLKK